MWLPGLPKCIKPSLPPSRSCPSSLDTSWLVAALTRQTLLYLSVLGSRDELGYSIICNRIFSISKLINTSHCLIWFLRPGLPWHCRMPVWAVTMFATQRILIPGCLIKPSKNSRTWWTRIAKWSCPRPEYPADFQQTHELRRPRRDSKSTRGYNDKSVFRSCPLYHSSAYTFRIFLGSNWDKSFTIYYSFYMLKQPIIA